LAQAGSEGLAVTGVLAGPPVSAADGRHIEDAQASLGSRLRYLGPVHGEDRTAFYRSLDLFLFPTRYKTEAQPNVVLEALAHGVPVVAFPRGCIASDLGGDAGVLVPADADFCEHVLPLLDSLSTDADKLATAKMAALRRAQRLHTAARQDYDAMLRSISGVPTTDPRISAYQSSPTRPAR
jgi:glycosyltransferase involved in cell wall biosynthesis